MSPRCSLALLLVAGSCILTATSIFNPRQNSIEIGADGMPIVEAADILDDATSFAQVELGAKAGRPSIIQIDSAGHHRSWGSAVEIEEPFEDDNMLLQMGSEVVVGAQPEMAAMDEDQVIIDTNPVFLLQGELDLVHG
mmetsp:Transcript_32303/g.73253  ORF Transcript_32303/g.73253 Transcript_32303/m.73253 type:complete len:138 (-) Transcript_32303:131-544(-)